MVEALGELAALTMPMVVLVPSAMTMMALAEALVALVALAMPMMS